MLQLRKAEKKQSKIRIALMGVSGGGKTYSSLVLAKGLAGSLNNVAIIDTERSSADLYADLGDYLVLPIDPPYSPEKYIQAIQICESAGVNVIIIDSISHEWEAEGGILATHSSMMGNSFANWNKLTPRHNRFISAILQSKCHIVATIRTKQDYVLNERNGKIVPEKVGLKGIAREGTDYEFTIVFDINMKHYCTATKDRTGLFADKPEFLITEETGQKIKSWCLEEMQIPKPAEDNIPVISRTSANTTVFRNQITSQSPRENGTKS
mgnify:CR=1 FL=1